MDFSDIVGRTLDGKYRIEKELGRGGMGAVYLSTHIGTERPVAVKVIVPEFMKRTEFVERFRREARAAGRLRHPNVVDVTDFGIAETSDGDVAYLVMEYLDGCTLGEILEEEKQLPVAWSVDILEQVCSAVQEAHQQGIIHRDLKPDNIWLEPNQRGGYTVKVLDFGIAKLETPETASNITISDNIHITDDGIASKKTLVDGAGTASTFAGNQDVTEMFDGDTIVDGGNTLVQDDESNTLIEQAEESKTLIQEVETANSEAGTQIMDSPAFAEKEAGTQIMDEPAFEKEEETITNKISSIRETKELTRVGAVLGTPLYMSPEQCRGEHLTAQSDIYSLAVIAYQMLGGKLPFEGNFTEVMDAHKSSAPPPLEAKKVSRHLKKTVMNAMSKDPKDRPKDAEAFATILRAQSEGLGSLYRQTITIYGAHLPKFLFIGTLFFLPVTFFSILPSIFKIFQYFEMAESSVLDVIGSIAAVLGLFVGFFFGAISLGTITRLVAQFLAAPLRPLDTRAALRAVSQKWKTLLGLTSLTSSLSFVGFILCFIPGLYLAARFALLTPVIVMEDLRGKAALRRSNELFKRSPWTVITVMTVNFVLPLLLSTFIMVFITSVVANISSDNPFLRGLGSRPTVDTIIKNREKNKTEKNDININLGGQNPDVKIDTTETDEETSNDAEDEEMSQQDKYARAAGSSLRDMLFQIFWLPLAIFITSFISVLMSLLYIKTRQAGGETMQNLLNQFEDEEKPQTRWQKRIQKRLMQSGRTTGRH